MSFSHYPHNSILTLEANITSIYSNLESLGQWKSRLQLHMELWHITPYCDIIITTMDHNSFIIPVYKFKKFETKVEHGYTLGKNFHFAFHSTECCDCCKDQPYPYMA